MRLDVLGGRARGIIPRKVTMPPRLKVSPEVKQGELL